MNVLISGGSGLIGSAICKHLHPTNTVSSYDINPQYLHSTAMFNAESPLSDYFHKDQKFYFDAFIDCSWPATPSDQFKTWNTVIDHFKQRNGGKMILFSSIYGHKTPDFSIYAGTEIQPPTLDYAIWKAATEQATRYLAKRLRPWGIQVNAIAPGGVLDKHSEEFQDAYRDAGGAPMIQTKNILPVVDMLLHPDNAVNGEIIEVSGGWTL